MLAPPGLREYCKSPSNQAKCLICDLITKKGDWRFEYRTKSSSSLRDQRKIHGAPECLVKLNVETLQADLNMLRGWMKAEGNVEAFAFLEAAYEFMMTRDPLTGAVAAVA
jgi:hypothetical protein